MGVFRNKVSPDREGGSEKCQQRVWLTKRIWGPQKDGTTGANEACLSSHCVLFFQSITPPAGSYWEHWLSGWWRYLEGGARLEEVGPKGRDLEVYILSQFQPSSVSDFLPSEHLQPHNTVVPG